MQLLRGAIFIPISPPQHGVKLRCNPPVVLRR
nr:MAG TPA: hypothetical protein [Caudoviricetes sp.]